MEGLLSTRPTPSIFFRFKAQDVVGLSSNPSSVKFFLCAEKLDSFKCGQIKFDVLNGFKPMPQRGG